MTTNHYQLQICLYLRGNATTNKKSNLNITKTYNRNSNTIMRNIHNGRCNKNNNNNNNNNYNNRNSINNSINIKTGNKQHKKIKSQ